MRILIPVDPEIPVPPRTYGGVERIVAGLVDELRFRGHEVGLVAHPDSTCRADAFYPWAGRHSRNYIDSLSNMRVLRNAAVAFRPHVLHSFSRILYILPIIRSALPKIMSYGREPTPRTVYSRRSPRKWLAQLHGLQRIYLPPWPASRRHVARHS